MAEQKPKEKSVYWQLHKIIDMSRIEGLMLEFLCLAVMIKHQDEILELIKDCEGEREDRARMLNFEGFLSEFLGTALESRAKELDEILCYSEAKGDTEKSKQNDELEMK